MRSASVVSSIGTHPKAPASASASSSRVKGHFSGSPSCRVGWLRALSPWSIFWRLDRPLTLSQGFGRLAAPLNCNRFQGNAN